MYLSLNVLSKIPKQNLVSELFPTEIMSAWTRMLLLRQICCRGHCGILMQLQILLVIVDDGYSILLGAFVIDFISGRQL